MDPVPQEIRGPRDEWRSMPTVRARRGDEDLEVQNRHPSPPNWWKIGPPRSQAAAEALVAAMEVDACSAETRLAYRMRAEADGVEYDSGWHGVYAGGDLAAHVVVRSEAEDCTGALADMAPIGDWLSGAEGDPRACADTRRFGGEGLLFDCAIGGGTMDDESAAALRAAIGRGPANDPDLEARLYGLYGEGRDPVPNVHAFLSSAPTEERREGFLSDQLARCVGPEQPGGCAPLPRIGRVAAQQADSDSCARLVTAMGELVVPDSPRLAQATAAIVAVTDCAPEPVLRSTFLSLLEISQRKPGVRNCWSHRIRGEDLARSICRTPARAAGSWLAERCGPDAVAVARRILETHPAEAIGIFGEIPDTATDGALRVLSRCDPSSFERFMDESALDAPAKERMRQGLHLETPASPAAGSEPSNPECPG